MIPFDELKAEIKKASFETVRAEDDIYFEAVFSKGNLGGLTKRLENIFGAPTWPSKNKLPAEIEKTIGDYGGIEKGQTLYFWHQEGRSVFAMLWPWQSGEQVTLKVASVSQS